MQSILIEFLDINLVPSNHLPAQSQQKKTLDNGVNIFKINIKDPRTTTMTYIVNFE